MNTEDEGVYWFESHPESPWGSWANDSNIISQKTYMKTLSSGDLYTELRNEIAGLIAKYGFTEELVRTADFMQLQGTGAGQRHNAMISLQNREITIYSELVNDPNPDNRFLAYRLYEMSFTDAGDMHSLMQRNQTLRILFNGDN